MNPARVFGPAVVAGDWNHHWIWWVSEILGACFAVAIESLIFAPIEVDGDITRSPLWWWKVFLWKNGIRSEADPHREFTSWADATKGRKDG